MHCMGEKVRTVMPNSDDDWMRSIGVALDLIVWFEEAEGRGDDNVEGNNYEIRFLAPPLEVVFSGYLNGRGEYKGEGNNGFIMSNIEELGGPKAFVLKGLELPIRPPVL